MREITGLSPERVSEIEKIINTLAANIPRFYAEHRLEADLAQWPQPNHILESGTPGIHHDIFLAIPPNTPNAGFFCNELAADLTRAGFLPFVGPGRKPTQIIVSAEDSEVNEAFVNRLVETIQKHFCPARSCSCPPLD